MHESDSKSVVLLLGFILYALLFSCFAVLFGLATYQAIIHHATTPIAATILFSLVFLGLVGFSIVFWRLVYRAFLAASNDAPADVP